MHPNHFTPDPKIVEAYGIDTSKPYFVMRFASLNAHHDSGIKGINTEIAQRLIDILENSGSPSGLDHFDSVSPSAPNPGLDHFDSGSPSGLDHFESPNPSAPNPGLDHFESPNPSAPNPGLDHFDSVSSSPDSSTGLDHFDSVSPSGLDHFDSVSPSGLDHFEPPNSHLFPHQLGSF